MESARTNWTVPCCLLDSHGGHRAFPTFSWGLGCPSPWSLTGSCKTPRPPGGPLSAPQSVGRAVPDAGVMPGPSETGDEPVVRVQGRLLAVSQGVELMRAW